MNSHLLERHRIVEFLEEKKAREKSMGSVFNE
jgi:hypothetical protein